MISLEKLNNLIVDAEMDYRDCIDNGESIGKLTTLNARIETLKLLREVYYDD